MNLDSNPYSLFFLYDRNPSLSPYPESVSSNVNEPQVWPTSSNQKKIHNLSNLAFSLRRWTRRSSTTRSVRTQLTRRRHAHRSWTRRVTKASPTRHAPVRSTSRSTRTSTWVVRFCFRPHTKFAKVMFSQVSVCPQGSVRGRVGACMARLGRAWQGGCGRRGACMAGGHVWHEGACVAGETATAVDGTHPTGMHSCYTERLRLRCPKKMTSVRSKYPVGNVNACKGSFRCTVNVTVCVSGFFDLFDV